MQEIKSKTSKVIIVGAGPAGLAAASLLQKEKIPYVVLEGRMRVGGRVHSQEIDDVRMDIGACWIHSFGNDNPLNKYIKKFDIKQCSLSNRTCGRIFFDGEEMKKFSKQTIEKANAYRRLLFRQADSKAAESEQDISIYEGAGSFFEKKWQEMSGEERRCTQVKFNMKEHYEASSLKQLSAKNYQYRTDRGYNFLPACTYAGVLRKIAHGLNIELNKKVVGIERKKGEVRVICEDGSVYYGQKILVSLPLGVLKARIVKFIPELPAQHQAAIERIGMGLMNKIILSFSQNFWGPLFWFSIGCDERGKYPHFYNFSRKDHHILCCFITDDFARKTEKRPDKEIIHEILNLLKNVFKNAHIQLREAIITHWGTDEFSLGSYSAFHVGSSPEDSRNLRKPVDKQLWMMGEHCYPEHIGTAHGAFKTGQDAAMEVINLLKVEK